MPTSAFRRSTGCLIGSNRFDDMEPCNSILLTHMNKHIKQTSRTVGTPPITISTTCHKYSPFSIAFSWVEIRVLNLQALAQHRENSAAACKFLPSVAVQAAPLSPQCYAKPDFMGPHNRPDGKHPDAMFKDFGAFLNNMQDVTHCVAIYSGTREIMMH